MKCAKCGSDVPQGTTACPGCGLKIKKTPPIRLPDSGGRTSGSLPQQRGRPAPRQPRTAGEPGGAVDGPLRWPEHRMPPAEIPLIPPGRPVQSSGGAPPPAIGYHQGAPGQAVTPSDVHAVSRAVPPSDIYFPSYAVPLPPGPAVPGTFGPPGPPQVPAPKAAAGGESKFPWALVAVFGVGLIIIVVALSIFFTRSGGPTEAEETVLAYFEAVSDGDVEKIESLFTEDARPTREEFEELETMLKIAPFEIKDVKLKTIDETASEARVSVQDFTISAYGQSMSMSQMGYTGDLMVIQLRNVSGQWLIDRPMGTTPYEIPVYPTPSYPSGG